MNHYNILENSSIFNFKNSYKRFVADLGLQEFHNKIINPHFSSMREGLVFWWNAQNVDLNTPTAIDIDNEIVTYQFSNVCSIKQGLELKNDKEYVAILEVDVDLEDPELKFSVFSAGDNFVANSVITNNVEVTIQSGVNVLRFKTGLLGDLSDVVLRVYKDSATTLQVSFKNIVLTQGTIALLAAEYNELGQLIRWNNTGNYWEISIDNSNTWERIWTEGYDFTARITALIFAGTEHLIHQDNIMGGTGIEITPDVLPDGVTPMITISTDIDNLDFLGKGDWTKEDVTYQALLEDSDFKNVTYNSLMKQENVVLNGCTYTETEDSTGYGRIHGLAGNSFDISDLIINNDDMHYTFYFYMHVFNNIDDITIEYEYSQDDVTWFGPFNCGLKEIVHVSAGFKFLKIKVTFGGLNETNVYSYGLLYGVDDFSIQDDNNFLEKYTVPADTTVPTTITVPNGKWYHKNFKSLNVFKNGLKLVVDDNYEEVEVGHTYRSNQVSMLDNLTAGDIIEFQEYFSFDLTNTNFTRELNDLDDVDIDYTLDEPPVDSVLVYEGLHKWTHHQYISDVSSLTDVNLTSLSDGDVLTFDLAADEWVNKPTQRIRLLADLDDVIYNSAPVEDELLQFIGGVWRNSNIGSGQLLSDWTIGDISRNTAPGERILVYTSAGPLTMDLPNNPEIGDEVHFVDADGTFDQHNLIILHNTEKILKNFENYVGFKQYSFIKMIFVGGDTGWFAQTNTINNG